MSKKRILLVDDSNTVLMMERMILSREAYDLITARNGAEAVEKATAMSPDLILMDVVMPEVGGFEALAELRSQDHTRDIPVIMVTTRGEVDSVERGFETGCNDYVTKPINSLELISKIRNFIGE
jgi:CheY-like chemotaxis protein